MGILDDIGDLVAGESRTPTLVVSDQAENAKTESLEQCKVCHSTWLWLDSFGNHHCFKCQPPPSPSFIRGTVGGEEAQSQDSKDHREWNHELDRVSKFEGDRLIETVKAMTPKEQEFFRQRARERQEAGESRRGIGWRAIVDVRIKFNHWPPAPSDDELEDGKPRQKYYFPRS